MKKSAIIGLGLGVVGVIFAVTVFPIGGTGIDVVEDVIPYDCAKGWDDLRESLRISDPDAYKSLEGEEKRKVIQYETKILDEYHANWCASNHEEWQHRAKDLDGRLAYIDSGRYDDEVSWNSAIAAEYEYNERFPDGALQFQ